MAAAGDATNPNISSRMASLELPYAPSAHPVEFLSLSGKRGAQVRATVHSFGPLLLGKVLDLNDTQTEILALIFKYCDDNNLPLLDLKDLAAALKYLASDEGKGALADYGGMSAASVGVLLRAIVVNEQEGSDIFFGEPEFDVADLLRTTPEGEGVVSLLELPDVMSRPRLFSTFMLWMLAQLYETLPEVGDLPKPKLCFFFDEAHLLFDDASQALMDEIERTARLIRSKGVGVYFVTQSPTDVPSSVLSQLGNRVQHALRAFTPEDADNLRKTARTFPMTEFYDVEKLLTSLGIGEAAVTVLSPRGIPTPLAATRLVAPDSQMSPIPDDRFAAIVAASPLNAKYGATIDRDSAYERINARLDAARQAAAQQAVAQAQAQGLPPTTATGMNTMTPAQQRREIQRQVREQREREKAVARQRTRAGRGRTTLQTRAGRGRTCSPANHQQRHPHGRQGGRLASGPGHSARSLRHDHRRRPPLERFPPPRPSAVLRATWSGPDELSVPSRRLLSSAASAAAREALASRRSAGLRSSLAPTPLSDSAECRRLPAGTPA